MLGLLEPGLQEETPRPAAVTETLLCSAAAFSKSAKASKLQFASGVDSLPRKEVKESGKACCTLRKEYGVGMAPDNRIGGHYSGRFGWIVWFVVLFVLAYNGDASDVRQDAEGSYSGDANSSSDYESGKRSTTPPPGNREKGDYANEEGKEMYLNYSAASGTDFLRMLKPAGAASKDFLSVYMQKELQNLERVNSQEDKKAWPVIVFENDYVVCSCLAIYDKNANTLVYDRLLMHPDTVDKARARELLFIACVYARCLFRTFC